MGALEDIRDRLASLKQARRRAALEADGSDGDAATDRLIRLHRAIVAMEAVLAEGEPDESAAMDLAGYELAGAEPGELVGRVEAALPVPSPSPPLGNPAPASHEGGQAAAYPAQLDGTVRLPEANPWFEAWRRTVSQGGYRTHLRLVASVAR